MTKVEKTDHTFYQLNPQPRPYRIFGKKFIDQRAQQQMDLVMSLPVVQNGALMPDAHVGYGMPIGGVVSTKNELIPYAVGLDIGCRMALSVLDAPADFFKREPHQLKKALQEETHFGLVKTHNGNVDHEILERPEFKQIELLRNLRKKAIVQLGTSGGGNHFVEFGEVYLAADNALGLPSGNYFGLLSHSGSRGLGAGIANYYKAVAMDLCRLPKSAQHLAWLDLDSEAGMEYWLAMNLAGDYAKACHDVIHNKLLKRLGLKTLARVENHHNFAWKEMQNDGTELIIHRKGATPAKEGELGIIPGSMASDAYLVAGKGKADALNSAAHGAGRRFSRSKAKSSLTRSALRKTLKEAGVVLIGGGTDEAPLAYKNIADIMAQQNELVTEEGRFFPRIVRMDNN